MLLKIYFTRLMKVNYEEFTEGIFEVATTLATMKTMAQNHIFNRRMLEEKKRQCSTKRRMFVCLAKELLCIFRE